MSETVASLALLVAWRDQKLFRRQLLRFSTLLFTLPYSLIPFPSSSRAALIYVPASTRWCLCGSAGGGPLECRRRSSAEQHSRAPRRVPLAGGLLRPVPMLLRYRTFCLILWRLGFHGAVGSSSSSSSSCCAHRHSVPRRDVQMGEQTLPVLHLPPPPSHSHLVLRWFRCFCHPMRDECGSRRRAC